MDVIKNTRNEKIISKIKNILAVLNNRLTIEEEKTGKFMTSE